MLNSAPHLQNLPVNLDSVPYSLETRRKWVVGFSIRLH